MGGRAWGGALEKAARSTTPSRSLPPIPSPDLPDSLDLPAELDGGPGGSEGNGESDRAEVPVSRGHAYLSVVLVIMCILGFALDVMRFISWAVAAFLPLVVPVPVPVPGAPEALGRTLPKPSLTIVTNSS